jgi:hypothetical protein
MDDGLTRIARAALTLSDVYVIRSDGTGLRRVTKGLEGARRDVW